MLGRQAVARTDGAQVALGEGIAGGHVLDHVQRAAEKRVAALAFGALIGDLAQGLPCRAAALDQGGELAGLQGKCGCRAVASLA